MGNIVSYKDFNYIKMSNGLTDVFIEVIGISGSFLASEDFEKTMIIWILEKDQDSLGRGTIGFDLCEMLWDEEYFSKQKEFMLKVIKASKNKLGWNILGYEPNEELIMPTLSKFEHIIKTFKKEDIVNENIVEWVKDVYEYYPNYPAYDKCSKHNIFKTIFGCYICKRYGFLNE